MRFFRFHTREDEETLQRREKVLLFLQQHGWTILLSVLSLAALVLLVLVIVGSPLLQQGREEPETKPSTGSAYRQAYIASMDASVPYYTAELKESGRVFRGSAVTYTVNEPLQSGGETYYLTYFDTLDFGYVAESYLTDDVSSVVREKTVYVRTTQNLRPEADSAELGELVQKGTAMQVLGYDYLEEGRVHAYQLQAGTQTGYLFSSYVTTDEEEANDVYSRFGYYSAHAARGDDFGGGDAGSLDYFPREKPVFADNPMPEVCRCLYLTCDEETISHISNFVEYAKTTAINAFVINILDGKSVGYPMQVMQDFSPTTFSSAANTKEAYREAIQKVKDAGFYVIGRITTFNDPYLAMDHPEYTILDKNGDALYVAGSFWPSAYCREIWQYKVEMAKEAVRDMGFHEIQFDYVRFPDGTYAYEKDGNIEYHNSYDETKAQALQRFLMYACDELHSLDIYVGADLFGETSGSYVAAYGQYWPAISNVVDVVSGMPYPDHFSMNGSYRPWEHPYETVLQWAENAAKRQLECPTPAIARTWIQAYDAIRPPYNTYGPEEVGGQVRALFEAGLNGGFMAWNATCELAKLRTLTEGFEEGLQ